MTVEGMTIINTETRAVRSPVSGLTGGFSWFSLLLWGLDMVSRERHGSIQLPSDANKGVVSCNTVGSDETPTLVGTGVPHRQRSQGGAVWTITADRQKGSVRSRISQVEMGTEVEVSGVRGETSHHPRIRGTDNGSRKTHGRCRQAPRQVEPFAGLGASGTEALLRGQHSEGDV